MVAELVLERVAATVKASPLAVREPLLYRDGDVTHFGMVSRERLVLTRADMCIRLCAAVRGVECVFRSALCFEHQHELHSHGTCGFTCGDCASALSLSSLALCVCVCVVATDHGGLPGCALLGVCAAASRGLAGAASSSRRVQQAGAWDACGAPAPSRGRNSSAVHTKRQGKASAVPSVWVVAPTALDLE